MKIATLMTSAALVAFSASAFAAGDRIGPDTGQADSGVAQGNADAGAGATVGVSSAQQRTTDDALNATISDDPRGSGLDAATSNDDDSDVGERADEAGDVISDTADDVGDAIEDAAGDVEDFFD